MRPNNRTLAIFFFLPFAALLCRTVPGRCADETAQPGLQRQTVMIVGCENRIQDKKWKDYRIAFGVTDLLAQFLFDSGKFALVEEKAEIRDRLRGLHERLWTKGDEKEVTEEALRLADSAGIVIARLLYCGTPRTTVGFGPVHAARDEVIIKTEVELRCAGVRAVGRGQGTASKSALSTLFEFRKDAVLFDQTAVGLALKAAVQAAVNDLVAQYAKEKK